MNWLQGFKPIIFLINCTQELFFFDVFVIVLQNNKTSNPKAKKEITLQFCGWISFSKAIRYYILRKSVNPQSKIRMKLFISPIQIKAKFLEIPSSWRSWINYGIQLLFQVKILNFLVKFVDAFLGFIYTFITKANKWKEYFPLCI